MRRFLTAMLAAAVITGCAAEPTPRLLSKREQPLPGGTVVLLNVAETPGTSIEALVKRERGTAAVARVFVFKEGSAPGKDAPIERYSWTALDGLRRDF